jgi:hypothetical protein
VDSDDDDFCDVVESELLRAVWRVFDKMGTLVKVIG